MNDKKMMQIVGAVQRTVGDDKKTWSTKIGVAFQNKDGSYNLRFDYLPARLGDTTIQLREFHSKDTAQPNSAAAPPAQSAGARSGPRRSPGGRTRLAAPFLPGAPPCTRRTAPVQSDIHFLHYAADRYGYQRDRRESSVSSHLLRHQASGDKIIVRKDRDGHWTYFSVRDDRDHGTIIDFVQRRAVILLSGRSARSSDPGSARRALCPMLSSCPDDRRLRSGGPSPRCSRRRASR